MKPLSEHTKAVHMPTIRYIWEHGLERDPAKALSYMAIATGTHILHCVEMFQELLPPGTLDATKGRIADFYHIHE